MRIAIFHLGFFYSGGGEKLVLEEMRGLRNLGHHVTSFAPYVDREGCYPGVSEMAEIRPLLPPPPRWLPMKDPLWVALSCLLIPFMAWRFRSFDVFFGANQPGPWFACVLSKLLRKPYVIYLAQPLRLLHPRQVDLENGIRIREGDHRFLMAIKKMAGWLINLADRWSVTNAHTVLTNGDHVSRWIREVYGIENQVCAAGCHPVPQEDLDYASRWQGVLEVNGHKVHKPYVLLTNRHSPMKRFEYAIEAHKAARRTGCAVSLVITGQETEYTNQLRAMVDQHGLNGTVHFVGLVPERELGQLYAGAVLYVYPSPEEDFGMGIVEAMAAGTPVVAWNSGGPTGIVDDRITGFLVKPEDVPAFCECVRRLSIDPSLAERLGRAGHARAQDRFCYERHNRMVEETLAGALEGLALVKAGEGTQVPSPKWVER
ncbi:MAG: glycosyltransferase family 4 protein [Anaerolineales bacterium]|jgi:glycosyltransferase involved in cell wall biosynthesis